MKTSGRTLTFFAGMLLLLFPAGGKNAAAATPSGQSTAASPGATPAGSEKKATTLKKTPARATSVPTKPVQPAAARRMVTTREAQPRAQKSSALNKGTPATATANRAQVRPSATKAVNVHPAGPQNTPAPTPALSDAELWALAAQDIYFDTGKADLRPQSEQVLAQLAQTIKAHPNWKVQIEGNSDTVEVGTVEEGLALSERRADSARQKLLQNGVSADQLKTISYSNLKPVCTDTTVDCLAKNRRVHFFLLP